MTENFAELFEQSLANQRIKPGTILKGRVVEVSSEAVVVSAGLKSEAVIPASQFKNERGELEVKVGDEVEVALDYLEDGFGLEEYLKILDDNFAAWVKSHEKDTAWDFTKMEAIWQTRKEDLLRELDPVE